MYRERPRSKQTGGIFMNIVHVFNSYVISGNEF